MRVGGLAVGTRDVPVGAGPGGEEDTQGWREEEEKNEVEVNCLLPHGVDHKCHLLFNHLYNIELRSVSGQAVTSKVLTVL